MSMMESLSEKRKIRKENSSICFSEADMTIIKLNKKNICLKAAACIRFAVKSLGLKSVSTFC